MFKFKDLYVTLTPDMSDANLEDMVFYDLQDPAAPTVDSTVCPPPPVPRPGVPSTACCEGFSMRVVGMMLATGNEKEKLGSVPLKDYLAARVAKKEMKRAPVQEPGSLKSVADIEALEHKLNRALGELRTRKKELQKTPAGTK